MSLIALCMALRKASVDGHAQVLPASRSTAGDGCGTVGSGSCLVLLIRPRLGGGRVLVVCATWSLDRGLGFTGAEVVGCHVIDAALVVGLVTRSQARDVVAGMRAGREGSATVDAPWFAVAEDTQGALVATASPELPSGVFWSVDRGPGSGGRSRLLVAPDVAAVAYARISGLSMDEGYVRSYARSCVSTDRTPYREIRRVGAGITLRWASPDSTPTMRAWWGPPLWSAPRLEGNEAVESYRQAFDVALVEVLPRRGPVVATLSGGLDSSYLVAALAGSSGYDGVIHALTHRPLAQAELQPRRGWDPDEFALVEALARRFPGRIEVHPIVNSDLLRPLDAAAAFVEEAWLPAFNPANQVWLSAADRLTAQLGADRLFIGANGNAAFSDSHRYAAGYYLRRARLDRLVQLGSDDTGFRWRRFRSRVVGPLRSRNRLPVQASGGGVDGGVRPWLPADSAPVRVLDRQWFLEWLAGRTAGNRAAATPAATGGIWRVDPFNSRRLTEVAAHIEPAEWQRGDLGRGFARRVGDGRVPDEIRLRTRRGGQAWDSWFVIRHDRDRYLDEAAAIAGTPILGGWIDHRAVQGVLQRWPWGQTQGPPRPELTEIDRLLGLASFVRTTTTRLRGTTTR